MAKQVLMQVEYSRDDGVEDGVAGFHYRLERSSIYGPLEAGCFLSTAEIEESGEAVANSRTFKQLSRVLTDIESDKVVQFCASDTFLGATPGVTLRAVS
jgi:hypothetical protein